MSLAPTYRYAAIVITALFLLLQGVSLSHAASHGQGPHDHDGVICVLNLHGEADAIIPAPQVSYVQPARIDAPDFEFDIEFTSAPIREYRGREPPPRGPPSL